MYIYVYIYFILYTFNNNIYIYTKSKQSINGIKRPKTNAYNIRSINISNSLLGMDKTNIKHMGIINIYNIYSLITI